MSGEEKGSITLALVPALPGLGWGDDLATESGPLGAVRCLPPTLAKESKAARVAGHGAEIFPCFELSWANTDDLATVADVLSAARASALAVTAVSSEDALTALLPRLNLPTLQTLEFRLLASPSAEYVDFPFPTLLEPKALGIPIGPLVALLAGSRARALANVVLRPTVPNMLASQKRAAGEFREKLVAALPQGHGVDGVCVGLCALRSADRWDDLAKCKCAKASDKHFTDASRRRGRASAARIHAASAVLLHSERDDPARPCALFDLPYELLECVLAYAAQDDVLDHLAVRSVIKQVVDRDKLRCTLAAFARHDAAGVPRSRAFHEWCVNGGL